MANLLKAGLAAGNSVTQLTGGLGQLSADISAPVSYFDQLQPASWKGVPFVMLGGSGSFGRRNAVHEYPFRDKPYVEDVGRKARSFSVTGYLVGDDVIAQRAAMIAACEAPASLSTSTNIVGDVLVHPSYGHILVSLLSFNVQERWNNGRYYELSFSFVESGARIFPSTDTATAGAISAATAQGKLATAAAYIAATLSSIKEGAAYVDAAVATAESWVARAQKTVADATSLFKTVAALNGNFGRFASAAISGFQASAAPSATTLTGLIAAGLLSRGAVAAAGLTLAGNAGDPSNYASAALALTAAVLASVSDPGQQIKMLLALANFPSDYDVLTSPIGSAISIAQNSGADLFRRAALMSAADAVGQYLPSSADDAATVRARICDAIEAEMLIAADAGEDDVYLAFKGAYAAVSQYLTAAGAGLPAVITISSPTPLPSLVLAQRLYCDPSREPELVTEANPIHPAFMPTSFQGLAA